MKNKIISTGILFALCTCSFAQKPYSFGLSVTSYESLSKNSIMTQGLEPAIGFDINFRYRTFEDTYTNFSFSNIKSMSSNFNITSVRAGLESGNILGSRHFIFLANVILRNYGNKDFLNSYYSLGAGLGIGSNINIGKRIILRSGTCFEYHIPNKIGTFYNFTTLGLNYKFNGKKN